MIQLQSIKRLLVFSLIITTLASCSDGATLQTYYVDNELKPGFTTFDIPTSILNVETVELSEQQRRAYESVDKLNVLAYKYDASNTEEFKTELAKVKQILKDPKYEELMRGGNSADGKFSVNFIGEVDSINELVVFGTANDRGFMIARILGDDMNAKDLMSLRTVMNEVDLENTDFSQLTDFFK